MLSEAGEIIADIQTCFQHATIARLPRYGKCLFLDGDLQSAQSDQDIYHSALVLPAFGFNPHIRTALILGGGEGATAHKILDQSSVQAVTMIDIDPELVDLCKQHLPEWNLGAFDDPRLTVHYQDAAKFIEQPQKPYDLVVWDLTDPYRWQDHQNTPSSPLYSPATFSRLRELLSDSGLLSVECAARNGGHTSKLIQQGWERLFRRRMYILSFEEKWDFALYRKS